MKMPKHAIGGALVALCFSSFLAVHAAKLGDPAAPLAIKQWIKGAPVNVLDGKHLYVVEFWATWCPPCRESIPHLTALQKKFKDKGVVFIGVSDEPPATVKPFVTKMGDKMDYHVACDDADKTMTGYMRAYHQNGIPTAFVVSKAGKVLWYGHPMGGLEDTVEQVLAGKYDLQKAIQQDELRESLLQYQELSAQGDPKAAALGQKLLKELHQDSEGLCNFAFNIVANTQNPHRNFALADKALDQAEKLDPSKKARILGVRAIGRFESGKHQEGLALAKQAVKLAPNPQEKAAYQHFVEVMEHRLAAETKPKDSK